MLTPKLTETYSQNYIDMSEETHIPTQVENPKGLHQSYSIKKLIQIPNPDYDPSSILGLHDPSIIVEHPIDNGAEYFVLRLDRNGKDPNHINACRIGIQAYANAIEPFIPELAKDLRERYPVKQSQQAPVKTLQDCKDEVVAKHGFQSWESLIYFSGKDDIEKYYDEVAELYRSQPVPVTEGREITEQDFRNFIRTNHLSAKWDEFILNQPANN